jgi:hypothetical protein
MLTLMTFNHRNHHNGSFYVTVFYFLFYLSPRMLKRKELQHLAVCTHGARGLSYSARLNRDHKSELLRPPGF